MITKNRLLIAFLLTVIFSILLWKTAIIQFLTKEGLEIDNQTPKIFIINMDKDKERYAKIIRYCEKSDFSNERIVRFPAIVGKSVPPEKWLSSDALTDLRLIEKNGYKTHHHSLTRGAIGCFLSHYYVLALLQNL